MQAPQRSGVSSAASHPLAGLPSQSPKPAEQVKPHAPAAHVAVALAGMGHALPQRPQFERSSERCRHEPEQSVSPAAQTLLHTPPEHTCPDGHARPQAEQFRTSVRVSTSQPLGITPSQSARPTVHCGTHRPDMHSAMGFTT